MVNNFLVGKKGIIFGVFDDKFIVWKIVECCVEEGVEIILINVLVVLCFGVINVLGEKLNVKIIFVDVISMEDLENLFIEFMDVLGGKIDFVLYLIGMLLNVCKKRGYINLNYDFMYKMFDILVMFFYWVM